MDFKDTRGDKECGVKTLPVVFGYDGAFAVLTVVTVAVRIEALCVLQSVSLAVTCAVVTVRMRRVPLQNGMSAAGPVIALQALLA